MDEEWEQVFELLGLRENEKVSSALAGDKIRADSGTDKECVISIFVEWKKAF